MQFGWSGGRGIGFGSGSLGRAGGSSGEGGHSRTGGSLVDRASVGMSEVSVRETESKETIKTNDGLGGADVDLLRAFGNGAALPPLKAAAASQTFLACDWRYQSYMLSSQPSSLVGER